MDKQTIFDQINDIKQVANDYVGRLVDWKIMLTFAL